MRSRIPVRYGKPSNKVFPKAIHPDEGDDHGRRAQCGKTVVEHQILEFHTHSPATEVQKALSDAEKINKNST